MVTQRSQQGGAGGRKCGRQIILFR